MNKFCSIAVFTGLGVLMYGCSFSSAGQDTGSDAESVEEGFSEAVDNQPEGEAEDEGFELRLIYSNDTHSEFSHLARHASIVKELRSDSEHHLLLDAGDFTSAEVTQMESDALGNALFMNRLGYDVVTMGNHEFDQGDDVWDHSALASFVDSASFPVLTANVDFSADEFLKGLATYDFAGDDDSGEIFDGVITEIGGEKVGIFGITIYEEFFSDPGDVTFSDYHEAAGEAVAHFEQAGVNKIIGLTHIGRSNDRKLAEAVPGIDVIVGGHSHVINEQPEIVGETLVLQTGSYYENVGQLDLVFDKEGKITDYDAYLHPVAEAEADPELNELLALFNQASDETGIHLTHPLTVEQTGRSVADSLLFKAQQIDQDVTFSFTANNQVNGGLNAGDLLYKDVLSLLPYSNVLVIEEATGEELRKKLQADNSELFFAGIDNVSALSDKEVYKFASLQEQPAADNLLSAGSSNEELSTGDYDVEIYLEYIQRNTIISQ